MAVTEHRIEVTMSLDDFRQSLTAAEPPAELTLALSGLWWDGKGDWTRAHESAQQDEGIEGSWVHAYLHRKEGDQSNAFVQSGRQARLPGASGCGMAQHCGGFAGINQASSSVSKSVSFRVRP